MDKQFPDGEVFETSFGVVITLRSKQYASNDIYCVQRMLTWHDLFNIKPYCRNHVMLAFLNALYYEYDFLNGKEDKK